MFDVTHFHEFYTILIRRLYEVGRYFVQRAPPPGVPRLWWISPDGRLTEVTRDPDTFAALILSSPAVATEGPSNTRPTQYHLVTTGARHYCDSIDAQLAQPDIVFDHVITHPTLLYSHGKYVSPPKGFSEQHKCYSTVDPIEIPDSPEPVFDWLCDRLQLSSTAKARLLAWYVGLILRANFRGFPALLVRSPYKGTGKSCIARIGQRLADPGSGQSSINWKSNGEFAKILPAFRANSPYIWIDNVDSTKEPLASDVINSATQSGTVDVRVLGKSQLRTIDRPNIVFTMQGGQIDTDLLDRLWIVGLDEPPPPNISAADNLQLFAENGVERLRTDLVARIMKTRPLRDWSWPTVEGREVQYRYPDCFEYVAPVVEAAGLDTAALFVANNDSDSRAEYFEMVGHLAVLSEKHPNRYFEPEEIVAELPRFGYPKLRELFPETLPRASRVTACRRLLGRLPETVTRQNSIYRLVARGRAYRIETVEN